MLLQGEERKGHVVSGRSFCEAVAREKARTVVGVLLDASGRPMVVDEGWIHRGSTHVVALFAFCWVEIELWDANGGGGDIWMVAGTGGTRKVDVRRAA